MITNLYSNIDLNNDLPTIETFSNIFYDVELEIYLEAHEFTVLIKEYIKNNLDIDLDELNIVTILDTKSKRFVLDTEYLENNDINELIYLMDEFKYYFGRSVFEIRAAMNLNVLLRKILVNCSSYSIKDDGSIKIYYSLSEITNSEIGQYLNLN